MLKNSLAKFISSQGPTGHLRIRSPRSHSLWSTLQ